MKKSEFNKLCRVFNLTPLELDEHIGLSGLDEDDVCMKEVAASLFSLKRKWSWTTRIKYKFLLLKDTRPDEIYESRY